jgi:hypothetical protein
MEPVGRMGTDAIAATGFTQIGLALAGVDEDDGHLGLVSVTLPDHFGGGTELAGGAVDRRGGAESAELEFKHRGRMAVGEGDGVELAEAVSPAKVVAQLGVLVTEDAAVPEFKMAGEKGANPKLSSGADDGEGGRLDPDFAGTFPFPAAPDRETFRPAEVFAVVRMDEFRFAVIRCGGGRV